MQASESFGKKIVAHELMIQRLLANSKLVGGIYTMGYDECLVLTNDLWKKQAVGIPQHCFLLATAMMPGKAPDIEDEEIILLRVLGPAPLPAEADLVHVREQAMREMVVTKGAETASSSPAIIDVLTRNEIQFSGIKAKIIGTFYDTDINGTPLLSFGSDVETFYSASRYKVYKPYGDSLAIVASYPEITEHEERIRQEKGAKPSRIQVGSIRYSSSSRRRAIEDKSGQSSSVPVKVNIDDFISMKTAIFGMTRLGKSNTMKIIATAVFKHAAETNQKIGQLLFDPAGEYANVNVQDDTALAQIGDTHVTIFRLGASNAEPGIRSLSTNFFSDETIEVTWSIIRSGLSAWMESGYVQSFVSADVVGPEDESADHAAYLRSRRRRAALYATLIMAGFKPPQGFETWIGVNKKVLELVNNHLTEEEQPVFSTTPKGNLKLTGDNITIFWDSLLAASDANPDNKDLKKWIDTELDAILRVYHGTVGRGFRLLEPLRVFHSPAKDQDYASEVLQELISGKIVIVDLSLGSESILKFCSERIVNHILAEAARRFANNQEAHKIQIFIEEAHRLFSREKMKAPSEADPYVRLAKEAAKFKIGLIYATQEVTSVDPLILSNTSNWIITHLNNRAEVKELSKYYDFQDFAELTMKAEDVGFARLKARSGRYIIPMHIDLFSKSMISSARDAASESPAKEPGE